MGRVGFLQGMLNRSDPINMYSFGRPISSIHRVGLFCQTSLLIQTSPSTQTKKNAKVLTNFMAYSQVQKEVL